MASRRSGALGQSLHHASPRRVRSGGPSRNASHADQGRSHIACGRAGVNGQIESRAAIVQIGFTLAKSAWGKGFGTEMASAVLRYGFIELRPPRIAGMASLQNHASRRVLLKIGLERKGERAFPHPDYSSEGAMAWFEREAVDRQAQGDCASM